MILVRYCQASDFSKSKINLSSRFEDTYLFAFFPFRTVVLVEDGHTGVWALSFMDIDPDFFIRPIEGVEIFNFIEILLYLYLVS